MQIASTSPKTQKTRNALVRVAAIANGQAADGETRRRAGPAHATRPSTEEKPSQFARRPRTSMPFLTQLAAQTAGRFSTRREQRRNPGPALSAYDAADALRTTIRKTTPRPGANLELSGI